MLNFGPDYKDCSTLSLFVSVVAPWETAKLAYACNTESCVAGVAVDASERTVSESISERRENTGNALSGVAVDPKVSVSQRHLATEKSSQGYRRDLLESV